jgi:hypothetical protein
MALRVAALALLSLFLLQAQEESPDPHPLLTCPAGAPLGAIDLRVRSPRNPDPLPFQSINRLSEGDTILYSPIKRGTQKRPGEVALVMVPVQRDPKKDLLIVTDPKSAEKPTEWKVEQSMSLAVFVYGPDGLNKKKVRGFLSQDDQLIAQLADYAEKTSQTEALLAALSDAGSSSASMNAALGGFASQYGLAVQLDKNAPPAVQAQTLFATMNPQLATYNPLGTSTAERVGQTASVATAAATLFFGSPIGLAAGGTSMLMELRYIAFPDTQFRSSFTQPRAGEGLNLCGQRGPLPPHTRAAFVWATRIPNTPAPEIQIRDANYIPSTQNTAVPVEVPEAQWKYLQRARDWALASADGRKIPVKVIKLGNQRSIEIDLQKTAVPAADYRLSGFWDWQNFDAKGEIHVRPLSDFRDAKLESSSQDRLLASGGKIPITVTGSDFQFTTKVELKKVGDEFATAEPVPFLLPKGLRLGPQASMDVQIDTAKLDPGSYELLVSQGDAKSHPVNVQVLPDPPKIVNLPILANQGVPTQHYVLKGERLDLLKTLEAADAKIELGPSSGGGAERTITLQLKTDPRPGTIAAIAAILRDRNAPLTLPDALEITGPLPVIASSKLSLPGGMAIALLPEEFPAGYTFAAMLDVKNIDPKSVLRLACAEGVGAHPALHLGEQNAAGRLEQLSQDQLFLSYDTSVFPSGCTLQAILDNAGSGQSKPFQLAHIIRLPRIVSFQANARPATDYTLTGSNLEMIAKVGWDPSSGIDVPGLPIPIPGEGQQQSLLINLPEPPNPRAPLFLWLRGESTGRATTVGFSTP